MLTYLPSRRPMKRALVVALCMCSAAASAQEPSTSRGTPAKGSLTGGVSMEASGAGFITYSRIGHGLGRQYVHSKVRNTLVAAFAKLHERKPDRVFVLGETGLKGGGSFRPHRTHQNGLSVDIFFPVTDASGRSAVMPTGPTNKFGYALEFDRQGKGEDLRIDFGGTAELLSEIRIAAEARGLAVQKVITAPEYVDLILRTPAGKTLGPLEKAFVRKPVWVRHDEHLHIDFALAKGAR